MESIEAIEGLAALAQSTRLDVFRVLVRHEPDGLSAGSLARMLDVPPNTLSSHLAVMARAGLVRSRRDSRSIIYRAELERLQGLVLFLLADCCQGRSEVCDPLLARFSPCPA
ncbi:ArsR family transcriptional regulator [Brevundimonas sp. S30B]|uniref:ArsR/SmtB family transcription factor n=1 Tax=unclassified Brevundimonas TaxID=2622653 RepID=UPI001071966B|nr:MULTISPECIES: metalloregulator ArsR/SmtB family transcription factor [unclassified Brevundimonas]QBX38047.1 ArsR family transcriptional regulator [Brevundimonas sp. MF30-B]TFW02599.1 ArsR family transcriptional regulator [Brevundimonas sp. S30B]